MKYFLLVLGFCLAPLSLQAQSEDNGAYIELQVQGSGAFYLRRTRTDQNA